MKEKHILPVGLFFSSFTHRFAPRVSTIPFVGKSDYNSNYEPTFSPSFFARRLPLGDAAIDARLRSFDFTAGAP